jgi:hypothetical protein
MVTGGTKQKPKDTVFTRRRHIFPNRFGLMLNWFGKIPNMGTPKPNQFGKKVNWFGFLLR